LVRRAVNQNKFTGPIPTDIKLLKSLTELHIWENRLTGHIPSEVGLLTWLEDLNCRSNFLSGPIPAEFGNLSQVQQIDLSDQRGPDKLSGPLLPFTSNPLLHVLNVSKNALAGTIPADLLAAVDKTKHVVLDMSSNQLSGGVPSQFSIFEQLDIFAADNMISALPEALCSMENWMHGQVGTSGTCDAILCPPGTFSATGRANGTSSCVSCRSGESANYFGSMSCTVAAQESERDILNKFYNDLNGDEWVSNFNWGTGSGICTWFGITCNDALSVVEIKLASNQIVGARDALATVSRIFELPNLEVNRLGGCTLLRSVGHA
jgi:Leucine rich repeat N-terminal domain